ncbi:unnamed protein product [Trichobilharzia regenti]|nr:unnamed protein product [Trichobilharzia regenti]
MWLQSCYHTFTSNNSRVTFNWCSLRYSREWQKCYRLFEFFIVCWY